MSIDTLAKELVDYFLGERRPMPVYSLAKEYVGIAKFDLGWQSATAEEAVAAIRRAAELGLVEIRNEIVHPATAKLVEVVKTESSQMELF